MKVFLNFVLLLFSVAHCPQNVIRIPGPGGTTGATNPNLLQFAGVHNYASGAAIDLSASFLAGDTIIGFANDLNVNTTISSVTTVGTTCNGSSNLTKVVSIHLAPINDTEIWAAANCTAASTAGIVFNWSGGGVFDVMVGEGSNLQSTLTIDGTNQASGTISGNAQNGPSITTTDKNDLILTIMGPPNGGSATIASPYADIGSECLCGFGVTGFAVQVNAVPASYAPPWTGMANGTYTSVTAALH